MEVNLILLGSRFFCVIRIQTSPIKMVFGFNQGGNDYGVMLYHCNRLIKAYEKIGIQNL